MQNLVLSCLQSLAEVLSAKAQVVDLGLYGLRAIIANTPQAPHRVIEVGARVAGHAWGMVICCMSPSLYLRLSHSHTQARLLMVRSPRILLLQVDT